MPRRAARLVAATASWLAASAICSWGSALRLPGHPAWCGPRGLPGSQPPATPSRAVARAAEAAAGRRPALAVPLLGALGLGLGLGLGPGAARAKLSAEDKKKINIGYNKILFLLDNWEEETTDSNGKRTPDKVRSYLGIRSIQDPLFNLDKTLIRATDEVDVDMIDEFQSSLESWQSQVAEGNSAAFISAFGEYNPGGGQDMIAKYLENSRLNVVKAKKELETIAKALSIDLKP